MSKLNKLTDSLIERLDKEIKGGDKPLHELNGMISALPPLLYARRDLAAKPDTSHNNAMPKYPPREEVERLVMSALQRNLTPSDEDVLNETYCIIRRELRQ